MPALAFGLLAWVVHRHGGLDLIRRILALVGWQWPLLLLPVVIIGLLTILAYRTALPGRGKAVPLWPLIQVERSGTALNTLLPFGNNSSHIVKIGLLRHWYSSEEIASAGVWCAAATGASNLYAAIGPLICLAVGFGAPGVVLILAGISIVMSVPMIAALMLVGKGLSARMTRLITLVPLGVLARRKDRMLAWAERLDTHVASATGARRADFVLLMFYRLLSQVVRVGEIWLVIEVLHLPGGILAALLYHALNRAVLHLVIFVPGRIGVMEAISESVFEILGFSGEAGLQIALVLRLRFLMKLLIGYTAMASLPGIAEKYPAKDRTEADAETDAKLATAAGTETATSGSPSEAAPDNYETGETGETVDAGD